MIKAHANMAEPERMFFGPAKPDADVHEEPVILYMPAEKRMICKRGKVVLGIDVFNERTARAAYNKLSNEISNFVTLDAFEIDLERFFLLVNAYEQHIAPIIRKPK